MGVVFLIRRIRRGRRVECEPEAERDTEVEAV